MLVDRCPYYDLTPDIGSPTSTLPAETAGSDDTSYFSNLTSTTDTCAPSVSVLQSRQSSLSALLAHCVKHVETAVAGIPAADQAADLQHAWMSYTLNTYLRVCAIVILHHPMMLFGSLLHMHDQRHSNYTATSPQPSQKQLQMLCRVCQHGTASITVNL